jgi:hypothetical protein
MVQFSGAVTPHSLVEVYHRSLLVGLLDFSSTLKMEAICSSETPVATQRTTRRHIPEDDTLRNHRCENLKSYKFTIIWEVHTAYTSGLNSKASKQKMAHVTLFIHGGCLTEHHGIQQKHSKKGEVLSEH